MNQENSVIVQEKNVILLVAVCLLIAFVSAVVSATSPSPKEIVSEEEAAPMEIVSEEIVLPAAPAEVTSIVAVAEAFVPPVDEPIEIVSQEFPSVAEPVTIVLGESASDMCSLEEWGVQFKCDEKWGLQKEFLLPEPAEVVISEDPRIIMSWKKFDENVRFLGQLNDLFFRKTELYRDGFRTERVKFAGHEAILVKGFASDDQQTQRRDYFYLNGDKLVSISFAVSPEDKWDEGKLVIQEVKNTFSRIGN